MIVYISEFEQYPAFGLEESGDVSLGDALPLEVDDATARRWKAGLEAYERLQDELRDARIQAEEQDRVRHAEVFRQQMAEAFGIPIVDVLPRLKSRDSPTAPDAPG